MINSRPSNDYLHTEVILSKVSEYDIFRYYCPNFRKLDEKFCSDIRKDETPSVSITNWNKGLLYKDFGYPDHTFNCFSYVMAKYNIGFIECLHMISKDFGLGLVSSNVSATAKTYNFTPRAKKRTNIKIKSRDWGNNDAEFWKRYGISKRLLIKYNVIPIDYFWVNHNRFRVKQLGYAFKFDTGYKIYQPYEIEDKWYSNVGKNCIQGYNQLPDSQDLVFLTSSLKDVMTLVSMGYPAVALQSEMTIPDKMFVDELNKRFCSIVVFYDNDFKSEHNPGQRMAHRLCEEFGFDNICIPDSYGCKDISDLVCDYGLGVAKQFIKHTLDDQSRANRSNTKEVCSDDGQPWY